MEAKKSDGILPGFGRNVVSTVKYNGGIIIGLLIICLLLSVILYSEKPFQHHAANIH